jgi:hypothetical protein
MNKNLENNIFQNKFSLYTNTEGFDSHGYNQNSGSNSNDIKKNQLDPIKDIGLDYNSKLYNIKKNFNDLSLNITKITNNNNSGIRDDMSGNYLYDYNTPFSLNNKPKTLLDGMLYDNNILNVQENSIYVLGTITAATLIVFAIMIGKE